MVCERGQHAGFLQRKEGNIYIPVNSLHPRCTKKMSQKTRSRISVFQFGLDFHQQARFLKVSKLYLFEFFIKFDEKDDTIVNWLLKN